MAWKVSTIGREESFEKSSIVLLEGGPKIFLNLSQKSPGSSQIE